MLRMEKKKLINPIFRSTTAAAVVVLTLVRFFGSTSGVIAAADQERDKIHVPSRTRGTTPLPSTAPITIPDSSTQSARPSQAPISTRATTASPSASPTTTVPETARPTLSLTVSSIETDNSIGNDDGIIDDDFVPPWLDNIDDIENEIENVATTASPSASPTTAVPETARPTRSPTASPIETDNSSGNDDGILNDSGSGSGDVLCSMILEEDSGETQPPPSRKRPNIIIMQPDDLPFLDEWTGPPNLPTDRFATNSFPYNNGQGLPNIEYLRLNGVQMMQAYAASPICASSRYSTITGKMPSRAASVRAQDVDPRNGVLALVNNNSTRLQDIGDLHDCSEENLARSFQKDPEYKTAMIGKWHLSTGLLSRQDYNYDTAVDIVQQCGFDTVKALYFEGKFGNYVDERFSHNMEWMTYEAIGFINATVKADEKFFMYFNPTVPHKSADVEFAIRDFKCTDVPDLNRVWDSDPWIKGMSEDDGCEAYRNSILERARGYNDLGKIWLDDAVGALLNALRDNGILDDTIFLFQGDHGMDTKSSLFEGGVRIPKFVHYPNGIARGTTFDGLVSTVDVAATMMDYAGIIPSYELDGKSWKAAIDDPCKGDYWKYERCVFLEYKRDRAVRCGCYKYLNTLDPSDFARHIATSGLSKKSGGNFFDLCDGTNEYITDNNNNREETSITGNSNELDLTNALQCHLIATDPNGIPDYEGCTEVEEFAMCPNTEDLVAPPTPPCQVSRGSLSVESENFDISSGEISIPSALFLLLNTVVSGLILFA